MAIFLKDGHTLKVDMLKTNKERIVLDGIKLKCRKLDISVGCDVAPVATIELLLSELKFDGMMDDVKVTVPVDNKIRDEEDKSKKTT